MNYQQLINSLLYTFLTAMLPVIVTFVVKFLKEKIEESTIVKEATKSEELSRLVKDALYEVTDAVVNVNQTYVDSLKNRGEFTPEAQKEAFDKAYEQAANTISEKSKEAIEFLHGSFEVWLAQKIEVAVNGAKKN